MRKSFKYKLYHQKNNIRIGNLIDDMHQVHVHFMKLQRRYYRLFKKYIPKKRMNKHLTKLKRTTKPHWTSLPSQACQNVLVRINFGYQKFFDNIEERKAGITKKKIGRPQPLPSGSGWYHYVSHVVGNPYTRNIYADMGVSVFIK